LENNAKATQFHVNARKSTPKVSTLAEYAFNGYVFVVSFTRPRAIASPSPVPPREVFGLIYPVKTVEYSLMIFLRKFYSRIAHRKPAAILGGPAF